MNAGRKYRVLIVEPSPIVQRGLQEIIASDQRFKVVGVTSGFAQAAERLSVLSPDIVVINPCLSDLPEPHQLRDSHPALADTAMIALVYAYFREDVLKRYEETVSIYDDPSAIVRKLLVAVDQCDGEDDSSKDKYDLSIREKEILVSVARGLMNKEIADLHSISIHTVITHRKNITRKTGIKTVAGLTIYAILNGMIDMTDVE